MAGRPRAGGPALSLGGRGDRGGDRPAPSRDIAYASLLAIAAGAAIVIAARLTGARITEDEFGIAVFFFLFGLFTIMVGYPHPTFGHVSFDRVAQVSSLLVLGPVDAAIINGCASLVYPVHRLRAGQSLRQVVTASLHNAGLMSLMILCCGLVYEWLGGPIPMETLDWESAALVGLLAIAMQFVNEAGMRLYVSLRGLDPSAMFSRFQTAVEIGSVPAAVLVAIILNRMEMSVVLILLGVLSLGMLALKQFADMRSRLEALVLERTRELREKTLELERQATQDKLTGLYNRRYADAFVDSQLELAGRLDRPVALALADVDHFKRINDVHSHAIGDAVLQRISRMLESHCRETDMVARYGGEEFILCFPATELPAAAAIGEEMRRAVAAADWSALAPDLAVTISFGVAAGSGGADRESLLKAADVNLYRAKREGRNRVIA